MSFLKDLRLFLDLKRELKQKRAILLRLRKGRGAGIEEKTIQKTIDSLKQQRLLYQEKAIEFENNGYSKIAELLLALKKVILDMESELYIWVRQNRIANEKDGNSP